MYFAHHIEAEMTANNPNAKPVAIVADRDPRPVDQATSRLIDMIGEAEKSVDQLGERIQKILAPPNPSVDGPRKEEDARGWRCILAADLFDAGDRVSQVVGKLGDLRDRLQI
jgi:hypothetical protein